MPTLTNPNKKTNYPVRSTLTPARFTAVISALVALIFFRVPVQDHHAEPVHTSRFIVKFSRTVTPSDQWMKTQLARAPHHRPQSQDAGSPATQTQLRTPTLTWHRRMSGNARVMTISGTQQQTQAAVENLLDSPIIEAIEIDARVSTTEAPMINKLGDTVPSEPLLSTLSENGSFPNDPLFRNQWHLHDNQSQSASIDALNAWQITQGAQDTVIAVIDTGIRSEHPDLAGRLLPGYDFVSSFDEIDDGRTSVPLHLNYARTNDGDGRDTDPTDPGDGVGIALAAELSENNIHCVASQSSWHGTGVASVIAANANDGVGVAGLDWNAMILPVRAIGRCGGHRSDLLDAIRWAAGVEDPTLPPNPHPAHIINLSLGMQDGCGLLDQAAINDAVRAGAVVVSAVGNQGQNSAEHPSSPSQCNNVIGVAATDETGQLAQYSNYGQDADIAAPGGTRFPSLYGVDVATNGGTLTETSEQTWKSVSGTSVAAPLISGTLGLMRSVRPLLSGNELTQLLLRSAVPFPNQSFKAVDHCDIFGCGTGLLNTHHAVRTAIAHVPTDLDMVDPDLMFNDEPNFSSSDNRYPLGDYQLGCAIVNPSMIGKQVGSPIKRDPSFLILLLGSLVMLAYRKAYLFFRASSTP